MAIRFVFPDATEIDVPCKRGLNILGHAQVESLFIGSVCGGQGDCGKDKIQLADLNDRSKLSPPSESEIEHLTQQETESGVRLGCQCFPADDDLAITFKVLREIVI